MPAPYNVAAGNAAGSASPLVLTAGTGLTGSTGSVTGDTLVVVATANSGTVTGVTDSRSNTYTLRQSNTSVTSKVFVFDCVGALGLVSGTDTITVTYSGAISSQNAIVRACAGVTAVDTATPNNASGTSAAPSVATAAALSQAVEWAVAGLANGNGGGTPSAWTGGFTAIGTEHNGTGQFGTAADQITASTSALTAGATITSTNWSMVVVTYKVTALAVTTASLPGSGVGAAYSQALAATGGTTPYTWSISAGSLPAGLTLTASTGVISGTPTVAATYSFTVQVTDAASGTATQPLSIAVGSRTILRPPSGFGLFGAAPAAGNPTDVSPYEAANMADRELAVLVRYYKWDSTWVLPSDITLANQGRILSIRWPAITTAGTNVLWADIAAGVWDSTITTAATGMAAYGQPFFMGFGSEFDAATKISANGGGNPANYPAAFRHIWNLVAPVAPNVIWVWCPTGNNLTSTVLSMYPGDQYVDWCCADLYDPTLAKGSPANTYTNWANWVRANITTTKPLGLLETGVDNSVGDAAKANWLSQVPATLSTLGIQIWCYFNEGAGAITPGSASATELAAIGATSFFNPPATVPGAGTPYLIGGAASTAASATLVISVAATTALHDAIVVGASTNGTTVTVSSVADSQGNTYVQEETQGTNYHGAMFVALNTAVLTAGTDTITVTYSGAQAVARNAAAMGCSGVLHSSALDTTPSPASGTSSTPSIASGPLATATELVVAWEDNASGGGDIAWVPPLTALNSGLQAGSNQISSLAAAVTATASSVTASGTITGATTKWAMMALSLKIGTTVTIFTTSLPVALTGAAYSATVSAVGGTTPYTWSISAGSLPSGMSIDSSTGVISGTAAAAGANSFTVQVTDAASNTDTQALSITVTSNLAVTTTTLPGGTTGTAYLQGVAAAGGTQPYTWALLSGSLPSGLSLDTSGTISGTPTAAGTSSFTVQVTDSASNTATQLLSITIALNLTITTTSLPGGTTGIAYSKTVLATGGVAPYTWSISAGSLPSGLSIGSSTGTISGTPSAAGLASFTVQVTDSAANTDTQALSIAITPATVVNSWTASRAIGTGTGLPAPPSMPLDCPVANGDGNGLAALVSWTLPPGYLGADMAVSDDADNMWFPLGAPSASSSAAGLTRCAIWAAPAAFPAQNVYVSPCGLPSPCYPAVIAVTVLELSNLAAYLGTPAVVTAAANNATSITASAAAPPASALMLTVAAADGDHAPSQAGSGWTPVSGVIASGGGFQLRTAPALQVASTAKTSSWTVSPAADLSACTAVILLSNPAPPQPSPNWPAVLFRGGLGSGALTPPGQITWTDLTSRWLAGEETEFESGKQYELDQLQSGENTATFDDNDGALTAGNTASPYYPNVTADVPLQLIAWWNGRTYGVLAGFAERWPVSWDDAWYGITRTTIADTWSLQQNQLGSVLREEITWDPNLYALWPCSDPAGSPSAQNVAPGNTSALQVIVSKSGALTAVQAFGADSGILPGDQSATTWSQTGLTSGDQGYGYCLYCADQNYPSVTNGVTVAGWFSPTGGATQIDGVLVLMEGANAASGPVFEVHLDSPEAATPGALAMVVYNVNTGVSATTTVDSGDWLQAGAFFIAVTLTPSSWALYLNGALAGSGSASLAANFSWLEFMGRADRFFTGAMLNGECLYLQVYSTVLPADRIQSVYLAGTPSVQTAGGGTTVTVANAQFAGEFPAQRIERLLAYGGWTGPRAISQSSVTPMAAITDIQGNSAVISASGQVTVSANGQETSAAVNNIVFSDGGFIFIGGTGAIIYFSRSDLYDRASMWTLGENGGAEIPYLPDAVLGYDKSLLYNGAELTPSSSATGSPVVASNLASIAQHGETVFNATAYQALVAQIADEANWIVNTRGTVTQRAQELTVDAMANTNVWQFLLKALPAQPVTVWRRPQTANYTVEMFPVIAMVTKALDFQAGTATAKITTDMFPEGGVLTVGDPVLGQANGLNPLAW